MDPSPSTQACEPIARALERFADGGPSPDAAWRAHARTCPGCGARYRRAVEASARAARSGLRSEVEPEPPAPRARLPLAPFAGALGAAGGKSGRGGALRILLVPALLLLALTRFSGSLSGRALPTVELRAGVVQLGETTLAPGEPLRLGRGAALRAGEGSAAVLRDGESTLALGPRTALLVERVGPPRVRLERGSLELSGPAVVTTAGGVLSVAGGRARVALERGALEIACEEGALEWVDARGARRLAPGERIALDEPPP